MEILKDGNSNLIKGLSSSTASVGVFGAVAGGTVAAVTNSMRVAKGEISGSEAVSNVAKESVGTGLSTAAGMAAMRALGAGGFVGFIAFFAVAGLAKVIWDSVVYSQKKESSEIESPAE
jgi:hypothetical protein